MQTKHSLRFACGWEAIQVSEIHMHKQILTRTGSEWESHCANRTMDWTGFVRGWGGLPNSLALAVLLAHSLSSFVACVMCACCDWNRMTCNGIPKTYDTKRDVRRGMWWNILLHWIGIFQFCCVLALREMLQFILKRWQLRCYGVWEMSSSVECNI